MKNVTKALATLLNSRCDKIPAGYFTAKQWRKKFNLADAQTTKRLGQLISAGLMECEKFSVVTPTGKTYPTWHYRLK